MDNIPELQKARGLHEVMKVLSHLENINMGVLALVAGGDRVMRHLTSTFQEDVSRETASHYSTAI